MQALLRWIAPGKQRATCRCARSSFHDNPLALAPLRYDHL